MDVRGEDHSGEAAVDAAAGVERDPAVAVPGPDSGTSRLRQIIALRDAVRVELHRQLDDNLDLQSADPKMIQSLGGTVLDELAIAQMAGLGINLSISTRHPGEEGRAVEDPSVTAAEATPKPLIELVRG